MNLGVFVWNSVWLVLFWKLNYIYPNCKNYKKWLFAYISGKILEMPNFSSQDFETVDWKHRQMCLVNLAATICLYGSKGSGDICREEEEERLWALSAFCNGVVAPYRSWESQTKLSPRGGWGSTWTTLHLSCFHCDTSSELC